MREGGAENAGMRDAGSRYSAGKYITLTILGQNQNSI